MSFAAVLAILVTLNACGPSEKPPPRVMVIGIDGLDAEVVDLLVSEGRMPNLERLRRDGAYGVLQSDLPMLSPILWTTMATGRTPDIHGVGSFTATRSTDGAKQPVTSSMRRVDALWNLASGQGRQVGVVGWWATWPPEAVDGVIVSDHTCFHLLFGEGQSGSVRTEGAIFPPERAAELEGLIRRPDDITWAEASRFISVEEAEFDAPFDFANDISHFRWALATADSYRSIGRKLWQTDHPDLLMLYIEGTDSTSHLFGHLFRAPELAGELAEQQRRFGRAVEEIYVYADELVGEFMDLMDENTTLMVISDHGFKLGELHDDPTVTNSMRRVSDSFHDLDGIIYMGGRGVRAGVRVPTARQLDITPTVLELLGLPAADNMPGRVLTEALTTDTPRPRVDSYETTGEGQRAGESDAAVNREVIAHLEALGYLDGDPEDEASEGPSRSHADMLLRAERFEEAAAAFEILADENPENASVHLNLAVALSNLGRLDEALIVLDRVEELDPTNPLLFYNRGAIYERLGNTEAAVEMYRQTLRADGSHQRAKTALERLTGSARVYIPANEEEQRAIELATRAAQLARRGDYRAADEMLDESAALAPDLALVHQYRANVAYLAGDLDAAIAALERSIELEPGNARVEQNLKALRARRAASQESPIKPEIDPDPTPPRR